MALTSLVGKIEKRTDPAIVTVEIFGETLKFRRPGASDLSPSPDLVDLITRNCIGLPQDKVWQVAMLSACYRADSKEGQIQPWQMFAEIAIANDLAFQDIYLAFEKSFPELVSWINAKAQAKNDSGAVRSEDSDTEQPTSLPESVEPSES